MDEEQSGPGGCRKMKLISGQIIRRCTIPILLSPTSCQETGFLTGTDQSNRRLDMRPQRRLVGTKV